MCPAKSKPSTIDTSVIDLPDNLRGLAAILADGENPADQSRAERVLKTIVALGYELLPPAIATHHHAAGSRESSRTGQLDQLGSLKLTELISLWHSRPAGEWPAETYERLGRAVLQLGEPLLAYDVLSEGLKDSPMNVPLRQLLGLARA